MKIFKYEILPNNPYVRMPINSQILSAGCQGDRIFLWAMVNPLLDDETVEMVVFGTGHEIDDDIAPRLQFINTVFLDALVFHVFKRL